MNYEEVRNKTLILINAENLQEMIFAKFKKTLQTNP
jgi:hypothetical protein